MLVELQTSTTFAVAEVIRDGGLYEVGQFINKLVQQQLAGEHLQQVHSSREAPCARTGLACSPMENLGLHTQLVQMLILLRSCATGYLASMTPHDMLIVPAC